MSYAIVEASGKQFWIEPGKFYDLNHIELNPGDKIALVRVLLINSNGNVSVGQPCIPNASIEATVLGHIQSRKITVYKMRPKKKTRGNQQGCKPFGKIRPNTKKQRKTNKLVKQLRYIKNMKAQQFLKRKNNSSSVNLH